MNVSWCHNLVIEVWNQNLNAIPLEKFQLSNCHLQQSKIVFPKHSESVAESLAQPAHGFAVMMITILLVVCAAYEERETRWITIKVRVQRGVIGYSISRLDTVVELDNCKLWEKVAVSRVTWPIGHALLLTSGPGDNQDPYYLAK